MGPAGHFNKWVVFVATVPVMLSSGVTYSFAVWADSLKTSYGLSQTQITAIGSACNLGGFFAILAGLFYDRLEAYGRLGPRLTLVVGAAFNAAGYLGLWAAATRRFDAAFWQLLALAFVACNGGTWFDAAGLVTNVRNFPSNRGMAVGVLKSGVGLSASFYTALYLGLLQPNTSAYLLLLALAPSTVAVGAAAVFNHVPFVQQSELEAGQHVFTTDGRFLFAYQAVGTLAVYLMTTALVGSMVPGSEHPTMRLMFTVGAGVLLLPLLVVAHGSGGLWALPAHPQWRDAEAGQLRPHRHHRRRHLRVGRMVALDPDSPEAALLSDYGSCHSVEGASPGRAPARGSCSSRDGSADGRASAPQSPAAGSPRGPWQQQPQEQAGVGPVGVRPPGDSETLPPSPFASPPAARQSPFAEQQQQQQQQDVQYQQILQPGAEQGERAPGAAGPGPLPAAPPPPAAAAATAMASCPPPAAPALFRKQRREVEEPKPAPAPDLTPLQCLASLDFWLLLGACCGGMGAGLTLNNNLGQLVRALGGVKDGQDVFVLLYGVANCAGRLLMGYIPERMLHSSGVPRPAFLLCASLLTTVVMLALSTARLPALYPLSLLAGLAFGAHWALMPSLASELFGLHHFAANYALLQFAPAIGSFGLASRLAGSLYQRAIARHGGLGNECQGQDCFSLTFLIVAGLAVLASGCSAWLYLRTWELYSQVTFREVHQHDLDVEREQLLLPAARDEPAGGR